MDIKIVLRYLLFSMLAALLKISCVSANTYVRMHEKWNHSEEIGFEKYGILPSLTGDRLNHVTDDFSDDSDYEKITITSELKKNILNSPYKATLRRADGKKFIAYLYADKIITTPGGYKVCKNDKMAKYKDKTGHYYIYFYDIAADLFFPGRIEIFNEYYSTTMGIYGAYFFSLPTSGTKKSDILLVSQYYFCDTHKYEVYGFTNNGNFLKKYSFFMNRKSEEFYGVINKSPIDGKFTAYGEYVPPSDTLMYLTLSDNSDEIKLVPADNLAK